MPFDIKRWRRDNAEYLRQWNARRRRRLGMKRRRLVSHFACGMVKAMHAQGMTAHEIIAETHWSRATVYRCIGGIRRGDNTYPEFTRPPKMGPVSGMTGTAITYRNT